MSRRRRSFSSDDEFGPVRLEKLVPGGQALGTLESGKKVFLWGALPGELVFYRLTEDKAHYCEGIATRVVEAADSRILPKDECYLSTSPWQIMDYGYELEQKLELVKECLRQQDLDGEPRPLVTDGKEFYYRNKMEYALYWDKEKEEIRLAFHERGTHRKIPIEQSSLEKAELWAAAKRTVDELNAEHVEARSFQSMLVRSNQLGETRVALFENGKPHPKVEVLKDKILGYEYSYAVDGFFQINIPVYEMALKEMRKYVGSERVLDLYAGVGTIGLSVARGRQLTAVELNPQAYAELEINAKNASDDIFMPRTSLERAENSLNYITDDITVILDPPRAGCEKSLIQKLKETKVSALLYLSCNPITAARDIALLCPEYEVEQMIPYNFFPRTPHIELLTILRRSY